jgi:hypothetical protein
MWDYSQTAFEGALQASGYIGIGQEAIRDLSAAGPAPLVYPLL